MNRLFAAALVILSACSQPTKTSPRLMTSEAFEEVSETTGLRFHHFTGATGEFYLPEIMGSGVALFDYDNDGDLDVFLVQGDFLESGKTIADARPPLPPGWSGGSRLFRNELIPSGQFRFTDVTASSGIETKFDAMGAAAGDYDNNGTLDLLVTGFGKCALFRNLGNGKFRDVTAEMGIEDRNLSTSAAFVDYDRDGWLDLFVTHYVHGTTAERKRCRNLAAELDYCGPKTYPPSVDRLYHNDGGKRFRDVTAESGIGSAAGPGLGVLIADFDGDNWPDIYVANDGAASFLWLNQKNGTFREAGLETGVAYDSNGKAQAGMGVAAGDIDNDGQEEIFKTNLLKEGANLYKRDASGFYTDIASRMNILGPTVSATGFGVGFADFDNDGWLDAFVANGAVETMDGQRGKPYPFLQPNILFHNTGGSFRRVEATTGPLAEERVGRGLAFGDLDNDGDIDIVISNNNGPVRLLRNTLSSRAGWLRVRLENASAGLRGYQAVVYIETESGKKYMRRIDPAGSYLSTSDAAAHFGLGADQRITSLNVLWPDGTRTSHKVDGINREVRVIR